jgi:hypothetical protein
MNLGSGVHRYPCKLFVAACDPSIKTIISSEDRAEALAGLEEIFPEGGNFDGVNSCHPQISAA